MAFPARTRERDEPFVLALLEGGVFLLAIPLAFLSGHKRQALFFATWFVLATAPLFAVFEYVEARYLATNPIALAGPNVMLTESFRVGHYRLFDVELRPAASASSAEHP